MEELKSYQSQCYLCYNLTSYQSPTQAQIGPDMLAIDDGKSSFHEDFVYVVLRRCCGKFSGISVEYPQDGA